MNKPVLTLAGAGLLAATIAVLDSHSLPAGLYAPAIAGKLAAAPLREVSGMVKSRSYPNTYWVVNDSGNPARLFAVNREGRTILPTYSRFSFYGEQAEPGKEQWQGFNVLYAQNRDWESMTADENYIYVADTGNNANNRRDLGIYMLSEIDPTASTQSAAIKYLPIRYPDQQEYPGKGPWHFDSEALFSAGGKLYLITKNRLRGGRT